MEELSEEDHRCLKLLPQELVELSKCYHLRLLVSELVPRLKRNHIDYAREMARILKLMLQEGPVKGSINEVLMALLCELALATVKLKEIKAASAAVGES